MKKTLDPILHRDHLTDLVAREVEAYFKDVVFEPLHGLLGAIRQNENKEHSAVWDALLAGTLWYISGVFSGSFNAAISRELRAMGAVKRGPNFHLSIDEVPLALRGAISQSQVRSRDLHEEALALLVGMSLHAKEAPTGIVLTDVVDKIVEDLQQQLVTTVDAEKTLPPVSDVPPNLTEKLRQTASAQTDQAVRNFTAEQLDNLRAKVRDNFNSGGRIDLLAKIIEAEFGIARRRARLIAENETSNLIAQFREERYRSLGSTQYVWVTCHDERVRQDHRLLNGQIFFWSAPPITNRSTGARNHPGEDINCRCEARPLIPTP